MQPKNRRQVVEISQRAMKSMRLVNMIKEALMLSSFKHILISMRQRFILLKHFKACPGLL